MKGGHTQFGNVFCLHKRIEPSAALFWALGIVLAQILKHLTQPSIPQVQQGSVRFNLREEEPAPPLFPSCCTYSMKEGFRTEGIQD